MKLKKPVLHRFGLRLTVYFSIIIIFLVLTISLSISFIFSKEITQQSENIVQQKMDIIINALDTKIVSVKNYSSILRNNSYLQDLAKHDDNEFMNKDKINREISRILSQYSNNNNSIISIIALNSNLEILDPLYCCYPYNKLILENKEFIDFTKSYSTSKFSLPSTFPMNYENTSEHEKSTLTFFMNYMDNRNYNILGYLLINLKKNSIFTDIVNDCKNTFDTTYVVDKKGNIIYTIGASNLGNDILKNKILNINEIQSTKKINNESYIIFNSTLKTYPDWKIVGVISYSKFKAKTSVLYKTVYLLGALCILVVIFISYVVSRRITKPIHIMSKSMRQFESGELPSKLNIKAEDEVKTLVKGFNSMLENIKNLINEIYKEEEEKKALEVNVLQAQLNFLQSQINPHFIHNTLNTVAYLAMKREAYDIQELIQAFNLLLRTSMSTEQKFITLKEEVSCIQSYLNIHKYRYDDIIKFHCCLPDEIEYLKIPKLILQPLVENSIYHGIVPKDNFGTIRIEFKKINSIIRIKVIDDGVGISKYLLPNILNKKEKSYKKGFNNIGLYNVNKRLILYFGNESTLKIYSRQGIGTTILFDIPVIN